MISRVFRKCCSGARLGACGNTGEGVVLSRCCTSGIQWPVTDRLVQEPCSEVMAPQ